MVGLSSMMFPLAIIALARASPAGPVAQRQDPSELDGRRPFVTFTYMIGDGDPHQNFRDTQISTTSACGDQPCKSGLVAGDSYTIEFDSSVTPAHWISGGFNVSRELIVDGEVAMCGGNAGDTVCLWHRAQHTAYTVQDVQCSNDVWCATVEGKESYVIKSPNIGGLQTLYCVKGDACRTKGEFYWEDLAITGGN